MPSASTSPGTGSGSGSSPPFLCSICCAAGCWPVPPEPMRLFVAVWLPAPVLAQLDDLARPEMAGVRWTTIDQWHVTLRFLGELAAPEPLLETLAGADLPRA